ncbi:MAG: SDR family NAD(P)-dependent oxidoreductase [Solirubrobacteraceae bacterium]
MSNRLEGKVAIVTGGAGGIGEGIARRLLAAGAEVAIADVTGAQHALADELGENTVGIDADVTDEAATHAMIERTVSHFGRLDVLCNNAGLDGDIAPITDCPLENYERFMAVNVRRVFLGIKHAVPAMLTSGGGSIINTASAAGMVGMPGLGAYSTSKAAVIGLTRTGALECSRAGVRSTPSARASCKPRSSTPCNAPTPTATPSSPPQRWP